MPRSTGVPSSANACASVRPVCNAASGLVRLPNHEDHVLQNIAFPKLLDQVMACRMLLGTLRPRPHSPGRAGQFGRSARPKHVFSHTIFSRHLMESADAEWCKEINHLDTSFQQVSGLQVAPADLVDWRAERADPGHPVAAGPVSQYGQGALYAGSWSGVLSWNQIRGHLFQPGPLPRGPPMHISESDLRRQRHATGQYCASCRG